MINKIDFKNVLRFTLPSIITMVFICANVMVGGIFVSNLINEKALSAINIVIPVTSVMLGIGLMLGTGGNAICAKLLGEGEDQTAKENFTLFCIVGVALGACFAIILQLNIDTIVTALGANENTYQYCKDYIGLLSWFFPQLVLQVIFQNALIAANKPLVSLVAMILGGLSNTVLHYVFIGIFEMGMMGSALATGIGYTIPTIIGIAYFMGKKNRILYFVKPKMNLSVILQGCANGSSEMVTNIATAVTTFLFNRAMLKIAGDDGVAAITVILYSQLLINAVLIGFTLGIAPVISFNFGNLNKENLRKLFKVNTKIIAIFSVLSLLVALVLAKPIVLIFTDYGSNMYDLTLEGLRIFSIGFLFTGMNIFASGMFTAYSNGKVSAIISFVRTFVFITTSLLVLPNIIGVTGVWVAVPIAEFLTLFMSIYFFNKYKKVYMYENRME